MNFAKGVSLLLTIILSSRPFFAQLEKSSASQKEYLEKIQEKKAAEKKEAKKKEQSKQTEVRKTMVQANSKEELFVML